MKHLESDHARKQPRIAAFFFFEFYKKSILPVYIQV